VNNVMPRRGRFADRCVPVGLVLGGLWLAGCARPAASPPRTLGQENPAPVGRAEAEPPNRLVEVPQRADERPFAPRDNAVAGGGFPEVIRKHRPFRLSDDAGPTPRPSESRLSGRDADRPDRLRPEAHQPNAPRMIPIEFPSERSAATAEIRDTLKAYLAAFNRHDDAALASHWSESAENIDLDTGRRVGGREAVQEVFSALFSRDAAASIDFDIESIRPIAGDVAVVDGISRMSFAEGDPARSRFSAVVVRQGGRWQIESVREAAAPEEPGHAAASPLEPLEWLRGEWEGVEPGKPSAMECHWSAGRSYLVRSHRVQESEAAAAREITEIIGHDPVTDALRSWIFASNGGFGEAIWKSEGTTATADGTHGVGAIRWKLLVTGTLADGRSVQGSLALTRIGDDGLTCILTGDGVEDLLPPEADYVRVARPSSLP